MYEINKHRYYEENKEYFKEYHSRYNKNPEVREKRRIKNGLYYRENIVKSRLYYRNNKKRMDEQNSKWAKNNPEKRLEIMKRHIEKYGKTFEMNPMEFSHALQALSKVVKHRDGNICQDCGSKDKLESHHILSRKEYHEFSLIPANGTTVCKDCHYEYT